MERAIMNAASDAIHQIRNGDIHEAARLLYAIAGQLKAEAKRRDKPAGPGPRTTPLSETEIEYFKHRRGQTEKQQRSREKLAAMKASGEWDFWTK